MRAVFIGINPYTLATARAALAHGDEVVIVERDRARIDELAQEVDCGFIHGDGTHPQILKECGPKEPDFLFCLTDSDQTNIIASLVGRSLGFGRVLTRIDDPQFERICTELGLVDTIVPSQTIGRHLADLLHGRNPLEISSLIKDDARVFSFVAGKDEAGKVADLKLPAQTGVICLYRDGHFRAAEEATEVKADDEVVLITHVDQLPKLQERWAATPNGVPPGAPK
jgi:trk system potassium uptake protein TrkA